jgi:GT2 family glycosyltransferase
MSSGRPPVGTADATGRRPHVAVVILHWGLPEVTLRCLQSLARAVFPGRKTLLLVDNTRCLDHALAGVAAPLEVEVHRPDRNLGFASGCAWGIARAMEHGADYILLLNNDVIVEPSFLEALLRAADQSRDAGLWCPQILSPRKLWYAGGTFSLWSGIPVQERPKRAAPLRGQPREVDYATGCAMLIDAAVVNAIGSFEPEFFMYCEDLDFSLRARRAGFKILLVPASLVHHAVTDETERVSLRIYYSTRNLLEVMRRHAAWYQWPGFSLSFLVRWVGFFTLLACARRRPAFIRALASGTVDFALGRLGEKGASAGR